MQVRKVHSFNVKSIEKCLAVEFRPNPTGEPTVLPDPLAGFRGGKEK